jgi:hypothetical protein
MQSNVITGNAQIEAEKRWGWFIGDFMTPTDDLRSTSTVQVKWGVHAAGDGCSLWAAHSEATSLSILIDGRFCLQFPHREVWLSRQGDYVLWSPGIAHSWFAEEASIVVMVRWPSKPGDYLTLVKDFPAGF